MLRVIRVQTLDIHLCQGDDGVGGLRDRNRHRFMTRFSLFGQNYAFKGRADGQVSHTPFLRVKYNNSSVKNI